MDLGLQVNLVRVSCIQWVIEIPFVVDKLKHFISTSVKKIDIVQLGIVSQAGLKILLRSSSVSAPPHKLKEMDLFAFIHHADPTKVQIGEKQIEEGQVPLLDSTIGYVIPLNGEDDQANLVVRVGHDDQNDNIGHDDFNKESGGADQEYRSEGNNHVGKDEMATILVDAEVQAVAANKPKGKRKKIRATGGASGSNHPPKKLRDDHGTSGNVSASTEREGGGNIDSIFRPNLRTQHPSERFVIFSDSSNHSDTNAADAEVISLVRSSILPPPVMTAVVTTTIIVELHGMNHDQLFSEFNVRAACQKCLGIEVRMRFDHNLRDKKRFERKCSRQADLLKEKDVKIANLKAPLSLKEAEVIEAIHLHSQVFVAGDAKAARVGELNSLKEQSIALAKEKDTLKGQVTTLESTAVTKDTELASLNAQTAKITQDLSSLQLSCDELTIKGGSLESQRDSLTDQASLLETKCSILHDQVSGYELFVWRWIIGHGLRLAVIKCRQSPEYAAAFGVVIGLAIDKGIQARLVAGIDHGKARRGLADVDSYDPSVEARYVSVVLAFRDLAFTLLSQLESQKDASITNIMNSLCLEGLPAETLEVSWLQPAYEQLLLPVYRKDDNVVVIETSLSKSLNVVHDRVQNLKEGTISHRTSISNEMGALVDILSSKNLIGKASTSEVPTTAVATTTLSISVTAASTSSIPPISMADYDLLDK
nr:hypothetical protein [Tanacetum cinerariifolium]